MFPLGPTGGRSPLGAPTPSRRTCRSAQPTACARTRSWRARRRPSSLSTRRPQVLRRQRPDAAQAGGGRDISAPERQDYRAVRQRAGQGDRRAGRPTAGEDSQGDAGWHQCRRYQAREVGAPAWDAAGGARHPGSLWTPRPEPFLDESRMQPIVNLKGWVWDQRQIRAVQGNGTPPRPRARRRPPEGRRRSRPLRRSWPSLIARQCASE